LNKLLDEVDKLAPADNANTMIRNAANTDIKNLLSRPIASNSNLTILEALRGALVHAVYNSTFGQSDQFNTNIANLINQICNKDGITGILVHPTLYPTTDLRGAALPGEARLIKVDSANRFADSQYGFYRIYSKFDDPSYSLTDDFMNFIGKIAADITTIQGVNESGKPYTIYKFGDESDTMDYLTAGRKGSNNHTNSTKEILLKRYNYLFKKFNLNTDILPDNLQNEIAGQEMIINAVTKNNRGVIGFTYNGIIKFARLADLNLSSLNISSDPT